MVEERRISDSFRKYADAEWAEQENKLKSAKKTPAQIAKEKEKFFEVRREFFNLLIHSDSAQIVRGLKEQKDPEAQFREDIKKLRQKHGRH